MYPVQLQVVEDCHRFGFSIKSDIGFSREAGVLLRLAVAFVCGSRVPLGQQLEHLVSSLFELLFRQFRFVVLLTAGQFSVAFEQHLDVVVPHDQAADVSIDEVHRCDLNADVFIEGFRLEHLVIEKGLETVDGSCGLDALDLDTKVFTVGNIFVDESRHESQVSNHEDAEDVEKHKVDEVEDSLDRVDALLLDVLPRNESNQHLCFFGVLETSVHGNRRE